MASHSSTVGGSVCTSWLQSANTHLKKKNKVRLFKQLTDYVSVYAGRVDGLDYRFEMSGGGETLRMVICSDLAAVLSSVKWSDRGDLLEEMMLLLMGLERMGVVVSFCWVFTHVRVESTEKADVLAKSAVRREGVYIQVLLGRREFKSSIKRAQFLAKEVGC